MTTTSETYETILTDFRNRFNTTPLAKELVKGWERLIVLDATDTRSTYALVVEEQQLKEVRRLETWDDEAENLVHLQAEERVLGEIFSGKCNPATALTDGALAIFSEERDKVKLEALAKVIWKE